MHMYTTAIQRLDGRQEGEEANVYLIATPSSVEAGGAARRRRVARSRRRINQAPDVVLYARNDRRRPNLQCGSWAHK